MEPELLWNPAEPPDDDQPSITLEAYRSPKDPTHICGLLSGGMTTGPSTVVFFSIPYGTPFAEALGIARARARERGIPRIVIHDPEGLGKAAMAAGRGG